MTDYNLMIEAAQQIYKDENTGHDFSHIQRVVDFCKLIHNKEGGDWDAIFISALFHDVHRVMSNKQNKYITPEESIDTVKQILGEFNLNTDLLDKILYIIEQHGNKTGDKNKLLELQIVQDADLLDSIGKIGLDRTIKYCINKSIPLYDSSYPLDYKEYMPNITPISATHYVYRTMLPKTKLLNTETAKEIANPEIDVLKQFIEKNTKRKNLD